MKWVHSVSKVGFFSLNPPYLSSQPPAALYSNYFNNSEHIPPIYAEDWYITVLSFVDMDMRGVKIAVDLVAVYADVCKKPITACFGEGV